MNALPILDSSPVAKFIAIVQQDPYAQMIDYLMTTAELALIAGISRHRAIQRITNRAETAHINERTNP
jgi:hypothetical protein